MGAPIAGLTIVHDVVGRARFEGTIELFAIILGSTSRLLVQELERLGSAMSTDSTSSGPIASIAIAVGRFWRCEDRSINLWVAGILHRALGYLLPENLSVTIDK